jgi:hypothetical protein
MEKMNTSTIGKLMAAFVAVMIAAVLIGQIATTGNAVTELTRSTTSMGINPAKTGVGGTAATISFYPQIMNDSATGWRASIAECSTPAVVTSLVVGNGSDTFVLNTDYAVTSANGSITFRNTNTVNGTKSNSTQLTYSECPTGYTYGWAATMLKLTYGMFALAALGVAIALFYSIAKDYGMI